MDRTFNRRRAALLAGCALGLVLAAAPDRAAAQNADLGFQGSVGAGGMGTVSAGSAGAGSKTTNITVESSQAVINWTPDDTATSGSIDFLPTGHTAAFSSSLTDYTVLNRILLSVVWCKLPVCALRHLDFTDRFPFQSPYRRGTAVSACSSAFGRSSLGTSTRSRTRSPRAWEWTARSSCATFCSCSSACRSRPSNHTSSTRSSRSAP